MQYIDLNHVALHVRDVERSNAFYRDLLGLPVMKRPDFSFPGAWYRIGRDQELHLIGGRAAEVLSGPRLSHFAMQVEDIEEAVKEVESKGIEIIHRQTRPDGAFQIYFLDPDGHCVELCQVSHLTDE